MTLWPPILSTLTSGRIRWSGARSVARSSSSSVSDCVMSGLCNSDISSVAFSMGPSGEGRFIAQYVRLSWFTGNSRDRRELACAWPAGMLKGDPRGGTPTYLADRTSQRIWRWQPGLRYLREVAQLAVYGLVAQVWKKSRVYA